MKTIGLLGGMSWESTLGYYREINEGVSHALGGLHSARIAMYSVDFEQIATLQAAGDWEGTADTLIEAAKNVQSAGADCLLICTNTMHKIAPEIAAAVQIPILHIADATAEVLIDEGVKTVGLLGTAFTMEQEFYKERLKKNYGLEVLVPNKTDREIIHRVIYQELCLGKIESGSRAAYHQCLVRSGGRGGYSRVH